MEQLYIQVKDGKPIEHPVTDWNLKMFFPELDPLNPPEGFEKFNRINPPDHDKFQKVIALDYIKVNDVWTDNWLIVDVTDEEKQEIINQIKENFPFKDTWIFNESTTEWIPPVQYPDNGNKYYWDNKLLEWIELPDKPYPNDGNQYRWNKKTKKWVKKKKELDFGDKI